MASDSGKDNTQNIQKDIEIFQEKKNIINSTWNAHTNQFFKQLNIPKLPDIPKYYVASFIFSRLNEVPEEPLLSQLTTKHNIHRYNTITRDNLHSH